MNLVVTAIVPQHLADGIASKLASVFGSEFIASAQQNLTLGEMGGKQVYCFSGVFTQGEMDKMTALNLIEPGVTFWVHTLDGTVVQSSQSWDVGSILIPKQLILKAGVTFPSIVESEAPTAKA